MVRLDPFSYLPYKALGISASYAKISWLVYPAFFLNAVKRLPIKSYSLFSSLSISGQRNQPLNLYITLKIFPLISGFINTCAVKSSIFVH